MNVLKKNKQITLLTLLQNKVSQYEIERVTGIDRKTIRSYQRKLREGELNSPGVATDSGPQIPPWPPTVDSNQLSAFVNRSDSSSLSTSKCEPHRSFIEQQLALKRNATAIYQDLVDHHGYQGAYNSVKRFAQKITLKEPEQFDRLEFAPGEEAQVDYGEGALTRVPGSNIYRRPRLFAMTLRYSRKNFFTVTWKSSQEIWSRLHEQAWQFYGGVPTYVVLDNLKEGVIKPDLYEPELNALYAMTCAHYGVIADPARVRDPNRKGTVESAIGYAQETALKGRRFETLEEQQVFLLDWERKWAGTRIHGVTKRQVNEMFAEEKAYLKALPGSAMQYFKESVRRVSSDTCVRVGNSSYAARPAAIGATVVVRVFTNYLEIRDVKTLQLLRTHPIALRAGSVILPAAERLFNPSRETWGILRKAEEIGKNTHKFCELLFKHEGRVGQRKMWGIVNLDRKYPRIFIEQACELVLNSGLKSYKMVRVHADRLTLEALRSFDHAAQMGPELTQSHALIRGTQEYANLFTHSAQAHMPFNQEENWNEKK